MWETLWKIISVGVCILIGGVIILFMLIFLLGGIFIIKEMRTYVQSDCLVKRMWLEKCGEIDSIILTKTQCVQPFWSIQYIDDETKVANISDKKFWIRPWLKDRKLFKLLEQRKV